MAALEGAAQAARTGPPAMVKRLKDGGIEPAGGPPKELRDLIERDIKRWNRVIDIAKIKRVG